MWNRIISAIRRYVFGKKKKYRGSYPSPISRVEESVVTTTITSESVDNAETLTFTIAPLVPNTQYTILSVFINNIIGNACAVSTYSEASSNEGAVAGNIRDTKEYDGSETYGGYIGNLTAHKNSYISILNSSGGALTYTVAFTIAGSVSISQSIA